MPDLAVYNLTSLTGLLGSCQKRHSDGQYCYARAHGNRQGTHQSY